MALQRPVFQIDGEDKGTASRQVLASGATFDILSVTGPGMVERGQWSITQVTSALSFANKIAIELVVDGVEVFNQFIFDADKILDILTNPPFDVDITGADVSADFTLLRPISFKTSLVLRLRNDDGSINAFFQITGAMQWTKGV